MSDAEDAHRWRLKQAQDLIDRVKREETEKRLRAMMEEKNREG